MEKISSDDYDYYLSLYKGVDFEDYQVKYFESKYFLTETYKKNEIFICLKHKRFSEEFLIDIIKVEDDWYLISVDLSLNGNYADFFKCDGFDEVKNFIENRLFIEK